MAMRRFGGVRLAARERHPKSLKRRGSTARRKLAQRLKIMKTLLGTGYGHSTAKRRKS